MGCCQRPLNVPDDSGPGDVVGGVAAARVVAVIAGSEVGPAAACRRSGPTWWLVARRAGSRVSSAVIAVESGGGQQGKGRLSNRMARRVAAVESRSKGPVPVVAQQRVAPRDHRSAAGVIGAPSNSSGAR